MMSDAQSEREKVAEQAKKGVLLPSCPASWRPPDVSNFALAPDWLHTWKARGAINAGYGVFVYLDQLSKSQTTVQPEYTACEQLTAAKP
jgi:hypothetical protein